VYCAVIEVLFFVYKFFVFLYLQREQFSMYSEYCLNKSTADRLIRDVGNENKFFVVNNSSSSSQLYRISLYIGTVRQSVEMLGYVASIFIDA